MPICCNTEGIHTCFFLNHIFDKTIFWSSDVWIYYFSLKSHFKVNMDTLAVPEIPKQISPIVFCNVPELSEMEVDQK